MEEKTIIVSIPEEFYEKVGEEAVKVLEKQFPEFKILPAVIKRPHA